MNCRHCQQPLQHVFLDLGSAPPSNAYLNEDDLQKPEPYFPLKLFVCEHCWLVQTEDYTSAESLFNEDYAYFSSTSKSWLEHAKSYSQMIIERKQLDASSFVVEIAANDGYLLKNFIAADIPCLGIEPTNSTADAAEKLGIPILRKFFGEDLGCQLAKDQGKADLIIGNNVLAHVPDINDFVRGVKALLKSDGLVTFEFPHLMQLIDHCQFDTVYHEHFSYLSLFTVNQIFAKAGLRIFDVEELSTHGGSLRIYGCLQESLHAESPSVLRILRNEYQYGLQELSTYDDFQPQVDRVKEELLNFLTKQKEQGKKVAAYGAAAKGNTLLNYAGVNTDLLSFVCDAATSKQGKLMPGSHIPIVEPEMLREKKPDVVLVLPWNIVDEVVAQCAYIQEWEGQFITAIPQLKIVENSL